MQARCAAVSVHVTQARMALEDSRCLYRDSWSGEGWQNKTSSTARRKWEISRLQNSVLQERLCKDVGHRVPGAEMGKSAHPCLPNDCP